MAIHPALVLARQHVRGRRSVLSRSYAAAGEGKKGGGIVEGLRAVDAVSERPEERRETDGREEGERERRGLQA